MKLKTPRGTFDVLPSAASAWQEVEEKARRIFALYNYREIRTPVFEDTALFTRGIGEATDIVEKEMYTFSDKKGRSLTLRPEGTAPIVRAYIEHNMALSAGAAKLFYSGPFFRYERSQAGRQRQFYQLGAEALGSDSPALDAEIIILAAEFLSSAGIKEPVIMLNNTGCRECRENYARELRGYLNSKSELLCGDCRRRAESNPLRVLDCKQASCAGIRENAPGIIDFVCRGCAEHFDAVKSYLDAAGLDYGINRLLVRGLDYYTRTTFEIIHGGLGAQNALLGGGRYDCLVEQLGGKPSPAAGFACGVERILMALERESSSPGTEPGIRVFAASSDDAYFEKAFSLLLKLRRAGISGDINYQGRSLKSQMKLADRLKAEFVLIVSDEIVLRNMSTGSQDVMSFEEVIDKLK